MLLFTSYDIPLEVFPPIKRTGREGEISNLKCLGCPFRVREYGQLVEHWQEHPRANSPVTFLAKARSIVDCLECADDEMQLLNFTISANKHSLSC